MKTPRTEPVSPTDVVKFLAIGPAGNASARMERLICSAGHEVRFAELNPALLETICSEGVDAVLLPAEPMGTDGVALCREVEDHAAEGAISIVVLSEADVDTELRTDYFEAGADHFLEMEGRDDRELAGRLYAIIRSTQRQRERNRHSERAQQILQSIPAGYVLADARNQTIVEANRTAADLLGLHVSEIIGKPCKPWLCETDAPGCPLRGLREQLVNRRSEIHRPDGNTIPIVQTVTPLCVDDSEYLLDCFVDISEQVRSEQELRQREESLRNAFEQQRAIFEASLVGIMVLENRIITSVNRRMAAMLGYTPEELIGEGPQKVHLSPENFEEFGERFYWRLAEREISQIEYPLRHRDGHVVWCLFNGRAIAPPDLSKGAVWIIDDITERKREEERRAAETRRMESLLALSQMRDRSIRETAEFGVEEAIELTKSQIGYLAVLDEDESILTMEYWSQAARKACAIVNKSIVVSVEQTGLWGEPVRQRRPVITNDYATGNPWKKGLPEGHVPIHRHMNIPVFDGDKIVAVAGVGNKEEDYDEHDVRQLRILMDGWWQVTQRRRVDEALRDAKDRYDQLAVQSRTVTWEVDSEGLYTYAGDVVEAITGYSSAEIVGKKHFYDLHPEEGREEFIAKAFEIFDRKESFRGLENPLRTKDGRIVWVSTNGIPLLGDDGTLLGYRGTDTDISNRKRAEEDLRESETRFMDLFYRSDDALILFDGERFTDCNAAAMKLYGYDDAQELLTKGPPDISPAVQPDGTNSLEKARRMIAAALETGTRQFEWTYRRRDGGIFPALVTLTAIAHRGKTHLHAMVRDLTEKKRAEEALWKALERTKQKEIELRGMLKASQAILECDTFEESARSIFDACREATGGTSGYVAILNEKGDENDILFLENGGLSCPVDPALPMPIRGLLEQAYRTGRVVFENDFASSEWTMPLPPGHVAPRNVLIAPLTVEGKVAGTMGLADKDSDFTKDDARIAGAFGDMLAIALRKARAEDTVRESEARFRSFVENAHDVVYALTPDGRFTYVSPNWVEFFGESPESAIGGPFEPYVHPDDVPACRAFLEDVLRSGEKRSGLEYRIRPVNGPLRWHTSTGSPLCDETGRTFGYVGISRDVTERKQYEEELARSKENLEKANAELQKAILRANDMAVKAEAANVAKSRFLANMSHEIRTPMNGVIGIASLLLDTELTAQQRDYVQRIAGSGESLLTIINDILDYSKIEEGKLKLEITDFDMRTTIEEISGLLTMRAHEKGLEYVCRIDPEIPLGLRGDSGRLRQVLINLIGNAIKFTEEGEVRLEVQTEYADDDEIVVRFEVSDTGVGIREDRIDSLFDPFTQADSSASRRFEGTGLGLTISSQLVQLLGGEIGLETEEGRGSRFWFTARFARTHESEAEDSQPPVDSSAGAPLRPTEKEPEPAAESLASVRVLLAEDNPTNQLVATAMLKKQGIAVDAVANGLEAVRALGERPYHLVLMDIQMPEMDGLEATRRIRDTGSEVLDSQIPIVAMTAHAMKGDRETCLEAGMDDYITKPVKPDELFAAVQRWMGGRRENSTEDAALEHAPDEPTESLQQSHDDPAIEQRT